MLTWRRELPDVTGWWWHSFDGDAALYYVTVHDDDKRTAGGWTISEHDKSRWAGPITPPPMTEEA